MFILAKVRDTATYTCGTSGMEFSGTLPSIVSTIVNIIKIGVPILLIVFGMLDLGKAVMAQKDDEIKKGQQTFIKRLTAAAIVFFVVVVVELVVGLVAGSEKSSISQCIKCFITGQAETGACTIK